MRLHHFGIACADIGPVKEWVKQTHRIVDEGKPVSDPLQQATLVLMRTADGMLIELIQGGQIQNVIKRGITLYHICYSVEDIDQTVKDFESKGAKVISAPQPAVLFKGKKVAFLQTPMGMIELLED